MLTLIIFVLQIEVFDKVNIETGIVYLKMASNKSHIGAMYALAVVLIFTANESNIFAGKDIIKNFKNLDKSKEAYLSYYKFQIWYFIQKLGKGEGYLFKNKSEFCKCQVHPKFNVNCDDCLCDFEVGGIFRSWISPIYVCPY